MKKTFITPVIKVTDLPKNDIITGSSGVYVEVQDPEGTGGNEF